MYRRGVVRSTARGGKCTWIGYDSTPAEFICLGLLRGARRININSGGGNFLSSIHHWGSLRRININLGGGIVVVDSSLGRASDQYYLGG